MRTKERKAWYAMKTRCFNPRTRGFKYWGGRGIKVCDRWRESFANFYEDVGAAPTPRHTIDRINNDGDYEPGNVRWATYSQQASNRRRKPQRPRVPKIRLPKPPKARLPRKPRQPSTEPRKANFTFRISPENLVWVKRRAANEHRKPSALVDLLITQLREKEAKA